MHRPLIVPYENIMCCQCIASVLNLSVYCQCVGRLLSDRAIGWQYETSVLPVYYQLLSVCKYND